MSGGAHMYGKGRTCDSSQRTVLTKVNRRICIFHGRPLSMLRSDIDVDLPKDRDDLRKGDFPSDVSHLCASIYLTHKLEDYLTQM